MGVQLIFVVETNKKCNSDWIYIKDTVDYFYSYEQTELKFTPIYMDGKGNYFKKEKEVKSKIKQYKVSSKENNSKVLYCFDCDESNTKQEDASFLKKVKKFCKEEGYEFVWFCKDIECVYIGNKVDDSQKKIVATKFKAKKSIQKIDKKNLLGGEYQNKKSNILEILNQYSELIPKDLS